MKLALSFFALTLALSTSLSTSFSVAYGQTLPSTTNSELQNADIENFGLKNTKVLALTFDDGPGVGTAKILDVLKKYNVKATFFSVGEMAAHHSALLDRIVAEGHLLANHSYDHPAMSKMDADQIISEIKKTHDILAPHYTPGQRLYFRAPYGDWRPDVAEKINQDPILREYIGPIYWNVGKMISRDAAGKLTNAGDWACWRKTNGLSIDQCLEGYLAKVDSEKGGVILMHDIHRSTAEMFEKMLPILIERGYKFVTMDQLTTLDLYETMQPLKLDASGKVENF